MDGDFVCSITVVNKQAFKWKTGTEKGSKGTLEEPESLGRAVPTSQLDFRGTGYKCPPPYLKRFGCS